MVTSTLKTFKHHIGEPWTREWMNTQNEEDIPTRNFKKKKKNKNILNWRQTSFHVEQKQNKKRTKKKQKKKTNKEKKKKRKTTTTTASETLKNFQILSRN